MAGTASCMAESAQVSSHPPDPPVESATIDIAMLAVNNHPVHAAARKGPRDVGPGHHLPHAKGLAAFRKGLFETACRLHFG